MSSRPQRKKQIPKRFNNYIVNIPKKKSFVKQNTKSPKKCATASLQTNSIAVYNKSIQTKTNAIHYQNLLNKLALCHQQLSFYKKKNEITKNLYKVSLNSKHSRINQPARLRNKFS